MAATNWRVHRDNVEQYASVVYRQSSRVEGSVDAHFLELMASLFVWAEPFKRQTVI